MKAFIAFATAAPLFVSQMTPQDEMHVPARPTDPDTTAAHAERCRDTIRHVREERGLPVLDRGTATPDDPWFVKAVDHRIDGCSILVLKDANDTIVPLPQVDARPIEKIPAR